MPMVPSSARATRSLWALTELITDRAEFTRFSGVFPTLLLITASTLLKRMMRLWHRRAPARSAHCESQMMSPQNRVTRVCGVGRFVWAVGGRVLWLGG